MMEMMLHAPHQPLLASYCEKLFHVVELNIDGMVNVKNVITRDPPDLIGGDSSSFRLFQSQPPYLSRRQGKERRKEPLDNFRFIYRARGDEENPSAFLDNEPLYAFRSVWHQALTLFKARCEGREMPR